MPLVRIDLPSGSDDARVAASGEAVHQALVTAIGVPPQDRFQVLTVHPAARIVADHEFLGVQRSDDVVIVQIALNAGRTTEQKQALYRAVADGLHASAGFRREDVVVNLIEVQREDWSFGEGVAQYVP